MMMVMMVVVMMVVVMMMMIVEHVDHPGADAEEGGEREDGEELGDEQQLGREGLPLQQVGRAGHQVVLGADLGPSVTSVNVQAPPCQ